MRLSQVAYFVYVIALWGSVVWAATQTPKVFQVRVIPVCAEDVVLVGVGSFENGRYAAYECGPAVDDYR